MEALFDKPHFEPWQLTLSKTKPTTYTRRFFVIPVEYFYSIFVLFLIALIRIAYDYITFVNNEQNECSHDTKE